MKTLNPATLFSKAITCLVTIFKPFNENGSLFIYETKNSSYSGRKFSYIVVTSVAVAIISSFTAFNYWQKLQNVEEQLLLAKGRTQMMASNAKNINYKFEVLHSITKQAFKVEALASKATVSLNTQTEETKNSYCSFN